MQLPIQLEDKVIRIFGDKGKAWFKDAGAIIDKCIQKWELSDLSFSDELSINLICFAKSAKFGHVALKAGVPHTDLFTEMQALSYYDGRGICKCYDYDKDLGAMILERIEPGITLNHIKSSNERIRIGAEVIRYLPIKLNQSHGLPSYSEWINRAFERARKENKVGEKMLFFIDRAEEMFKEIDRSSRPKVLLHGDLHHWNILKDNNGQWKAIDPKGIIAASCMESARFIENELSLLKENEKLQAMDEMTRIFGEKFDETKRTIAICAFILNVLSVCWTFEDYLLPESMPKRVEGCQFFFDYISIT